MGSAGGRDAPLERTPAQTRVEVMPSPSTRRFRRVAVALGATAGAAAAAAVHDRQRLWAGGDALPDVPEPQFSLGGGTRRPQLHEESNDPRGPAALLDPNRRAELLAQYEERGYVVCRGFFSQEQVAECRDTVSRIIDDWPDRTPPEVVHAPGPPFVDLDPRVVSGEVVAASPQLAVRRLFRLATHSEFFRRLLTAHSALLEFTKAVLGPNLKLIQSMALLKPPGTGEKRWHQDTGVMRLTPNACTGLVGGTGPGRGGAGVHAAVAEEPPARRCRARPASQTLPRSAYLLQVRLPV